MTSGNQDTSSGGDAQQAQRVDDGIRAKGKYRELAKEVRHGGFLYQQIAREGDIAIYQQGWTGAKDSSTAFEVIKIQHSDAHVFMGTPIVAHERYPGSEEWGKYGWTYTDKDQAFAKFKTLLQ